MRAIWTGAIGFGLVNIPVKIYSATNDSGLNLDMLDKKDHQHIRFRRVNEKTGKEVKWDQIVKAYDYEGSYVVLDDTDFEKASPEKNKILSIDQFVQEAEIDSVFFETPYFLEPQKSGARAYQLLLHALMDSEMAAIGTFVLRSKELLGCIRPYQGKVLLLQKIRFAEEIRDYDALSLPEKQTIKPAELKMAKSLISQLSGKFDPGQYKDTYTEALMKVIKAKAGGKTIRRSAAKVTPTRTIDLMAKLKASLDTKAKRKRAS
jgi:DNA end-binding protein Ku